MKTFKTYNKYLIILAAIFLFALCCGIGFAVNKTTTEAQAVTETAEYVENESTYTATVSLKYSVTGSSKTIVATSTVVTDTNGIEYTLSDDGTYYSITGYSGTATSITIPSTYNGKPVTEIGDKAFYSCDSLISVTIGSNIESIGEYAFYYSDSITSVTIGDSVVSIGKRAFQNCTAIEKLTIGSGVTSMGECAFLNCYLLNEINFNATAMEDSTAANWLFGYAGKNGTGIIVTIGANVTEIPGFLFYPYEVTGHSASVNNAPNIIKVIFEENSKCESIGQGAFGYCGNLTTITIPESVTSIELYAFAACMGLTDIYYNATAVDDLSALSSGSSKNVYPFHCAGTRGTGITVTIGANVTKLPANLFFSTNSNNTSNNDSAGANIISVVFEGNSKCVSIGKNAFRNCNVLESINIPKSVTSIGSNAFYQCDSLVSVTFENTTCWYITTTSGADSGTDLLSTDLADTATAATYLVTTYNSYYWYCTYNEADNEAPTMSGASTSKSGMYVNDAFTVTASDNIGVEAIYYKISTVSNYTTASSTDSVTIAKSATNGLWVFYCVDLAGNESEIYYVNLDTVAPAISGASTSATGLYTNSAFTITATDSGSGVDKLYYKSQTAGGYSSTAATSKSYTVGFINGLYSFYAVDKAGNTSVTYYVYYDNTAPTLTVSGATFGSSTGTSFTVTSSDTSGSATTLYYRKGSSGSFTKASSTSYTVSGTAGDGIYYFYATDKAGNTSSTYLVTLSTEAVSGEFVKSDTDNTVFFYWTNNSWTATLDGNSYTSGTWITEEGEHTIVLTSPTTGSTTYTRTIDHYYEAYQTVAATCTSQGYTIYKCSQCGDTYNGNYTDKAAHTYVAATTSATCTSQGYTTYTCTKCGDSYVGNYTSKTSHTYRSVVTAPTCTARGYTTYTCTRCGYSYKSNYIAATGHTYETTVVDATCIEQGYTIYTCIVCGYSYIGDYTETIPHSYQSTYIAPSCTEGGYMEYTCVNCGDKYTDETTLPKGHTYTITVIKSATCTETGLRHYCCDVCGYEYDAVIPATGHNYVITDVENNDGETTRTYECSNCGDSYTEDLGNQTEYVASYVEYLFDGYSNYIWWLLLATAGIWSIVMGVFFAIATKNEDKQKARKMVINYLIGLVVIAVILVAAPYLAYGIAVFVT